MNETLGSYDRLTNRLTEQRPTVYSQQCSEVGASFQLTAAAALSWSVCGFCLCWLLLPVIDGDYREQGMEMNQGTTNQRRFGWVLELVYFFLRYNVGIT